MSLPHIGYVLKVYPRLSETFIVNEILELERLGVPVSIISLKPPRDGKFHAKLARVKADVTYLPELDPEEVMDLLAAERKRAAAFLPSLGRLAWQAIASRDPDRVAELSRAVMLALRLPDLGVDHLHAHFATSATAVAMLASELSGIPYSFTAHAKDIYIDGVDRDALSEKIRRARFVVTVCDANQRYLEAFDHGATPIRRIYNGIDLGEFHPPAAPRRPGGCFEIAAVGRLIPKKGFDTLIRATRLLAANGLDFRCRVVGHGPDLPSLEALVAEEGVSRVVELTGALPDDRVRRIMTESDVMALPARIAPDGNRDALPTVLLEAMAMGIPVVSTPITGIPEIVDDGAAGELVPADRPDLLAAALERLARDPGRRAALALAAQRRVAELFDVRKNVGTLLEQFREEHAARLS